MAKKIAMEEKRQTNFTKLKQIRKRGKYLKQLSFAERGLGEQEIFLVLSLLKAKRIM